MRWNVSVAALAASWGFIAILVAAVDLDATVLVFYRLLLAGLTIVAVALARRELPLLRPPERPLPVIGLGLVLATHWTLYFLTIKLSSVAVAVVTVYTAPLFIAVIAPLLLSERRSPVALAALVPAVPGIVLVGVAGEGGGHVRPLAILTGLAAAASYAMLVVGGKRLRLRIGVLTFSFWMYVVATLALLPLLLTAGRVLPGSWREAGALLLLGIVFTGVSGIIYVTLIALVTAQAIGILAFVEPVSAAFLAWALLDQSLGTAVLVGGALVLVGGIAVVVAEPADAAAVEAPPVGSASQ